MNTDESSVVRYPLSVVGSEGRGTDNGRRITDNDRLAAACLETLRAAERDGYAGYSKFDALESPLVTALSFNWWVPRLLWTQLVTRSPVNLRPLLRVRRGINPEARALCARANLDCRDAGFDGPFVERARRCLDWLLTPEASSPGDYHGRCWGYHHAWQSPGFYQPPRFPNCYITCIVGGALLHGYRAFAEPAYLGAARSAVDFILGDLRVFVEDADEKCIGYVPDLRAHFQVININALAAALLAEVGVLTGEAALLEQARKLMTFVVRNQTPYGAWHYTVDPRQSLVTHDNYHTGMILDALLAYEHASGDRGFRAHYEIGLAYYRRELFLADGAPKWTNERVWPHDAHGTAQGTLTFALAGDLETATRIAAWGLDHLYKGDGQFAYQRGRYIDKRFTLFHWCNAWMVRGLGALLRAAAAPGERRTA
jgi:hypothetical protein